MILRSVLVMGLVVMVTVTAAAQSRRQKPAAAPVTPAPSRAELARLAEDASKARANLIKATQDFRQSLEPLYKLQIDKEKQLAAQVENNRQLLAAGIISRLEFEQAEQNLADAVKISAETAGQIAEADHLVMEVEAAEELAKNQPEPTVEAARSGLKLIRYTGTARFALIDHIRIDEFFRGQFGRTLPISALGQTGVHNRLGFDHRGALDVAVHPDSSEGRALMTYLRSQGIPFLAFRGAVTGSATGAHIHIGLPSHRIAPQK